MDCACSNMDKGIQMEDDNVGNNHFGNYREIEPQPDDDTFEIGLVMAGAVSAGAYTAGVLDFLIEALDEWQKEKQRCKGTEEEYSIPQHNVRIRIVTGASAGSMSAAILAVAARYQIPHFSAAIAGVAGYSHVSEAIKEIGAANPFYKAWVQDISMEKLLETNDLDPPDATLDSILDSTALLDITKHALEYPAHSIPPEPVVSRDYFADPVRYIFTLGSLRGLSFFFPMIGVSTGAGLEMSMHKDYRSFSVSYGGNPLPDNVKADDIVLSWGAGGTNGWKTLGMTALASGAFPVGLAARPLSRLVSDYDYRFVIAPGEMMPGTEGQRFGPPQIKKLTPNPDKLGASPYNSFYVDGGTMDNEPLDLARIELAGLRGSNIRDGSLAHRAVLMIDPFPDVANSDDAPAGQNSALLPVMGQLMGAWKMQARFNPEDLALAADENVYSRFLISPEREHKAAPEQLDIACGALGGFSGFFSIEYRHHDYLLGRRNAQKFLTDVFTLPTSNSLFTPCMTHNGGALLAKWGSSDHLNPSVKHLPIIPLVDGLRASGGVEELPSIWPAGVFKAESLREAISNRLDKVVGKALEPLKLSFVDLAAAKAGMWLIKGKILDAAIKAIDDGLIQGGLGSPGQTVQAEVLFPTDPDSFVQPPEGL